MIGHYGGSGVGLSTGGDAVNLFDSFGRRVTGFAFGASPSSPAVRAQLIAAYGKSVRSLVQPGWLTTSQAATLTALAGSI